MHFYTNRNFKIQDEREVKKLTKRELLFLTSDKLELIAEQLTSLAITLFDLSVVGLTSEEIDKMIEENNN